MLDAEVSASRVERGDLVRGAGVGIGVAVVAVCLVNYGLGVESVVAAAFVAVLTAISIVDVSERRIPNAIVLPAIGLTLAAVAALHPELLRESALAGAIAFLFFFVPAVAMPHAIGMGDAKLALLIGVALGADTLQALLVGSLLGGIAGGAVLISKGKEGRRTALPFGPFLAAGAVFALVAAGGSIYA